MKAVEPGLPALSDEPTDPRPLVLEFSRPAARVDRINRPPEGVTIRPEIPGTWCWQGDRRLVFRPKAHWPAAAAYEVVVPPITLKKGTLLAGGPIKFHTHPFAATIENLEVSVNPKDESRRGLRATVQFSHPVDADRVREAVAFSTAGASPVFQGRTSPAQVSVRLARQGRLAFIDGGLVDLPEIDDFIKLALAKSLRTAAGEASIDSPPDKTLKIPSSKNFFKIDSMTLQENVVNPDGVPEQILVVRTTADAKAGALDASVSAMVVPPPDEKKTDERNDENSDEEAGTDREDSVAGLPQPASWKTISAVSDGVIASGQPLKLIPLPAEQDAGRIHCYRFELPAGGNIVARVAAGAKAVGGYRLVEEEKEFLFSAGISPEIDVTVPGGLLALSGEKKISIKSRRLAAAQIDVCRVFPGEVNHLVSQTGGDFSSPQFRSWRFNENDISLISSEIIPIGGQGDASAKYLAFDLAGKLKKIEPRMSGGIFLLRLAGWDPVNKRKAGASSRRLVLVTDLGMIVKKCADGRREIFIQSLATGAPVAGVSVAILAKNGEAVGSAKTDESGRASLASVEALRNENKPVAILARSGDDLSFLPIGRADRIVDVSSFDTGGVELPRPEDLQAFGFTERGIYRPGDVVHLTAMLKRRDWLPLADGLPVNVEIFDTRGRTVLSEKRNLHNPGMAEFQFETSAVSPTGTYEYSIFVGEDTKHRKVLWNDSFRVEEFEPDRMKLEASMCPAPRKGWMPPDEMAPSVRLQQLFGASAADCRVTAKYSYSPWTPEFASYPGWAFFLRGEHRHFNAPDQSEEVQTDESGSAKLPFHPAPDLARGFVVNAKIEAFEPDGGRSVLAGGRAVAAPFDFLVGWKSDQNVRFLTKGKPCQAKVAAVDRDLAQVDVPALILRLVSLRQVSVLIKQENGGYSYSSVTKENVLSEGPFDLGKSGATIDLPTGEAGSFRTELIAAAGEKVLSIDFRVAGSGNPSVALEKSAETTGVLSNAKPRPGETVELSLTSPYTGVGLITIEREGVVAHQWFRTDTVSSVQKIKIPEGFEGTGYISVSMLRALDSAEIFTSPRTGCVLPFEAIPEKRQIDLKLVMPEKVKPGERLKIRATSDRKCKAVIFAVDEGILQVSDFQTPDPLAAFFAKRALLVETSQIIDQLMPEFSLIAKQSAFGGDGEEKLAKNLNPFSRVTEKPVVFWSGIVEAGPDGKELAYDVPDFFDGSLRVMAVALADDGCGAAEKSVKVAGPFVLQPSAPLAAAPGDEMVATVHVTRLTEAFPTGAPTEIWCDSSENVKVLEPRRQSVVLAPGKDAVVDFRVQVLDKLGAAELRFNARGGSESSSRRRTFSVRPLTPYVTNVRSGKTSARSTTLDLDLNLRPEYLKRRVAVSALPISLAVGLREYLETFPHGCTEQITSKAFGCLILSMQQEFGLSREDAAAQVARVLGILQSRQNNFGAFGLWEVTSSGNESLDDMLSCYVVDFLLEAKDAGFEVPDALLKRANGHLEKMASIDPVSLQAGRSSAYAIYLLTRQGRVTTNLLLHLRDRLGKFEPAWKTDLTALYLGGTHALLMQKMEVRALFQEFRKKGFAGGDDFYNRLTHESQFVTLAARHDPDLLKSAGPDALETIVIEIEAGRFNTISAAYAVQALRTMSAYAQKSGIELGVTVSDAQKAGIPFHLSGTTLLQGALPTNAAQLAVVFRPDGTPGLARAYYQLAESGFPKKPPLEMANRGIEVARVLRTNGHDSPVRIALGDELQVSLRIRSTNGKPITNVAIVDLLPAGFELVNGQAKKWGQENSAGCGIQFVDAREDRTVFYADISGSYMEISYRLKPIARGRFQIPPVSAASMYDRSITGLSTGGQIEVVKK